MAEATFFADPDYPVPGHGKTWLAKTRDGAALRFASWRPTVKPVRGTIVLVQGRAEFIERYSETVAELRRRGFHVLAFDWRGQGGSQRFVRRIRKGHVGRLRHYEADLALAMAEMQAKFPPPYFVLAHSMGAALCLDAARSNALPVARMVALAPMLGIAMIAHPGRAKILASLLYWLGFGRAFIPGGGDTAIATKPFEGNRLTSDPARYARNSALSAAARELSIGDPTIAWIRTAFRLMARLGTPSAALEVKVPTLIIAAGRDPVVSTPAIERFAARLKTGSALVLPTARHEILMENDAIRAQFWAAFDAFIPGEDQSLPGSAGEQGHGSLMQRLVAGREDAPAPGSAATVP
ncbi:MULTISPECIES: alpha/beta fold hydrolase [Bosea]|uniref:alpha/beta fold hydrolase n=1 Tax=Bosea TaxID=85413 RepID=UPI002150559B|nr:MULTISPECIES: alpha/beta hydrolase [Bosea]MCR4523923.1 alpha/beta hydrolase [Bosea sp. 47.2.35]MDR6828958.1 lysophospholipase [Bosea robiniae]MDR6895628.1 lysophospholipase [Bosea sp. BE109]MDR7139024.1 lysophospholipase [Bosea sp. BE168]MDR7175938.1 lysophospholipase [Bosea sp. BE271]